MILVSHNHKLAEISQKRNLKRQTYSFKLRACGQFVATDTDYCIARIAQSKKKITEFVARLSDQHALW